MEGESVTISGIVTSSNQFGTNGPASIQDETGAISIYGSGFSGTVDIGDSVLITSTVTHFNGLTQLDFFDSGSRIDARVSQVRDVEPLILTLNEIKAQEWNGAELFESRLVRVNGIKINASGNFGSGSNYSISDSTGSLELRIDNNVSSIIGAAIPSGEIDIVGIIGQYKTNPPYNSGYQLLPRFIQDIVSDGTPLILTPVVASDITTNSLTVYFNTFRKGNSKVRYGLTRNLELDSVLVDESTTFHKVKIDGLQPNTSYYLKAFSSNENGTSVSSVISASTSSGISGLGEINSYFNFSVDTSAAMNGNSAKGNVDFSKILLERINAAKYSIDIALYSFDGLPEIANALLIAKNRGVKIRVVYENRPTQSSMQTLINGGIKVLKRLDNDGLMHNKFAVFDARDETPENDFLWSGSWNWTSNELNWPNNVIVINDPTITVAYTTEFEEMWGSDTEEPDISNARFGPNKTDNTVHNFNIGDKLVELYFSPSDAVESRIVTAVNTANSSIYFSLLIFTSNSIANSVISAYNSGSNDIRGIIDDVNASGSEYSLIRICW